MTARRRAGFLCAAVCYMGALATSGAPAVGVALEGRVDARAFEPGQDYRLTLALKLALPKELHFNQEAPMHVRARSAKGVSVRRAAQVEGQPRVEVLFRTATSTSRAQFHATLDVPLCDAKAQVCLLKQTRWSIEVADGTVTAKLSKKGEAALVEGNVKVGDTAPTEGCVAKDASGKVFRLGDVVGKQPLILMTYRAFW